VGSLHLWFSLIALSVSLVHIVIDKGFLILGSLILLGGATSLWLRPSEVATAEVTNREISPVIQGVGMVEAKVVVHLAAKIVGRVVIINVDQGDSVQAGQVLVQLENAESSAELTAQWQIRIEPNSPCMHSKRLAATKWCLIVRPGFPLARACPWDE
jgi:multidrug efflux pump subunit AcrA (membrane-fusion protein)